tara:strand:- start:23959 stop:24444 length:486 start_codon:yes stop_codon:yes gene_type:complete
MEIVASLSQFQIAGLILQLVLLPFLFINLRRWWWAKQSVQWPKVKGVVVIGLDFPLSRIINFLYTYEINGTSYKVEKPFFANSFKNFPTKKATALMNKYPEGKEVFVFYSPSNHKIATLEPGRKDGVNGALMLLLFLFLLGFISFYDPTLLVELSDYITKQ